MKILFLCKANVSRSQMAAAMYNELTHTQDASSAGIDVDVPGETLAEREQRIGQSNTLVAMQASGFDISNNKRTQLTQDMLKGYGRIINLAPEAPAPDWLTTDPRYTSWRIEDPVSPDIAVTYKVKDKINAKLQELLQATDIE